MGKNIRIFIVEDEDQSRLGLVDLIASLDPEAVVVGQAANGRQALSSIVTCGRIWYLQTSVCR